MSESRSGGADKFTSAIPRGVYVPPKASPSTDRGTNGVDPSPTQVDGVGVMQTFDLHGGYVRIVDSRGKKFHCAFSRPVGSALEPAVAGRKRPRPQSALDASANSLASGEADGGARDGLEDTQSEKANGAESALRKVTITEERLHPEEALFLHIRGLLRIEPISQKEGAENGSSAPTTAADSSSMSTQDLFCQMLPQCKVPLAAYLAYAHLRAQGYILMRYSEKRMGLLSRLGEADSEPSAQKNTIHTEAEETNTTKSSGNARFKDRQLRSEMSEDVATAPPPCVVNLQTDGDDATPKIRLAYYAYNPNARFKRTNPGVPDFGVAVMPYRSDEENGPTFDDLGALVAMCEGGENATSIPLRVVTIADGGAAIAFGVARGEVPSINQGKG